MRLLFLTDSFRPSRSACANRVSVMVDTLRDKGIDVQVLASSDSLLNAPRDYEKPEYVMHFETFPLKEKTLLNRLRNNFGGQRASVRMAEGMGDFDVVVCTTPPLLLTSAAVKIARRKRAKLVLDVRDVWPDVAFEMGSFAPGSAYGRFFTHLARKAYAAADLVVSVSPGKVAKLKGRVAAPVALVPNGVDASFVEIEEDPAFAERFRLSEGPICAYVGNIGLAQGLGSLLDIAAVRPDVRFLLFGDGADRVKLERRVASEGIGNVEFCGIVDARGVRAVLRYAAFSFVPLVSSALRDSIPTKMYEALALGCPVLLAAEGDAADLLDECGLGAHVAPEDADALLAAFDRMIEQPFSASERKAAAGWTLAHHARQGFARSFVAEIEGLEGRHAS